MSETDTATPVKLRLRGEDVGIATPSGGLIFNPFHKDVMSRLGHVTYSPGIFTYTPSPIENSNSSKATPSRANAMFTLSPDTQGDLFPADIDENPILQLKLQEKLNTQCDDELQDTIHSFFKSHLIAPSPDRLIEPQPSKSAGRKFALPRTSSMLPRDTKMQRPRTSRAAQNRATDRVEVGVQTALSVPFDLDLEALLQRSLNLGTTGDPDNADEAGACFQGDDDSVRSLSLGAEIPSHGVGISFTACAVERLVETGTSSSLTGRPLVALQAEKFDSCQRVGPQVDRDLLPRSFSCTSLGQLDENEEEEGDEDEDVTTTQTCVDELRIYRTCAGTTSGHCVSSSTRCNSLSEPTAPPPIATAQSAMCSTYLCSDDDDEDSANSSYSSVALPSEEDYYREIVLDSPMVVGGDFATGADCGQAYRRHLARGGLYSSPSPPPPPLADNPMECSVQSKSIIQSPCAGPFDRSRQQRMLIWSPTVFSERRDGGMSFHSPELSPILPASRGGRLTTVADPAAPPPLQPPPQEAIFDAPAIRLFGSPEGQLSPVTSPGFHLSTPTRHLEGAEDDELLELDGAEKGV